MPDSARRRGDRCPRPLLTPAGLAPEAYTVDPATGCWLWRDGRRAHA